MMFGETLRVALDALGANKLRSALTMLGIVIGVGAVIAMLALGRGAQQAVNQRIAALGTTLLTVSPGQQRGFGGIASAADRAPMTVEDWQALDQRTTTLIATQPEMSRQLQQQRKEDLSRIRQRVGGAVPGIGGGTGAAGGTRSGAGGGR